MSDSLSCEERDRATRLMYVDHMLQLCYLKLAATSSILQHFSYEINKHHKQYNQIKIWLFRVWPMCDTASLNIHGRM